MPAVLSKWYLFEIAHLVLTTLSSEPRTVQMQRGIYFEMERDSYAE